MIMSSWGYRRQIDRGDLWLTEKKMANDLVNRACSNSANLRTTAMHEMPTLTAK